MMLSRDRAAARASHRGEVAVDRAERRQQGRALRRDVEVVEVGFVAVARVDASELLIGAVVDHLFALTEALRRDVSLPPGQDRPAAVLLHLQVGRRDVRRQRVEPHEIAGFVEDRRSRFAGPDVRGGEHEPSGRLGRTCGHCHDRWFQVGA